MTTSASHLQHRNKRLRARRFRLSPFQSAIEQHAIRFRADLNISELVELPLELGVRRVPNCEVLGLKHVPGMTLQMLSQARTTQYHSFGALARHDGQKVQIVFNDAHPPTVIRVNVMEEVFHILLGHEPDTLTTAPVNGRHRTYSAANEDEAYGCAIAALVPFYGLDAMLTRRLPITRIAEHFFVPVDVIQERIAATRLGDVANERYVQLALVPDTFC